MGRTTRAVILGLLLAAAQALSAEEIALSGTVTCSLCKGKHEMGVADPADCARACVKNGAKYVLKSGDQIYLLPGDAKQLDYYAEKKVKIRGEVEKNRIVKIEAISIQQ